MLRSTYRPRLRFMTAPPETVPGTPPADPPKPQGDPADLGEAGKKALSDERAARKAAEKSAADLKARLDQIESANLSDLEKAQREAQEARDQLASVQAQNVRNSIALAKGIPADLVDFLGSGSEDEIGARADVLLARLATQSTTTPKPDLTQGPKGDPAPKESLPGVPRMAQAFDDAMQNPSN